MKRRKKNHKLVWGIGAVIAIAALVVAQFLITGAPCDGMIKVRKGATIGVVEDSIAATIDVSFAARVATLLSLTGSDLSKRQGAFRVNKGDSPFKVMRLLRSGAESGVKFTFNNVRTKEEFAQRFASKFMVSQDSLLAALNDSALCARFDRTPATIVGFFYPDSYEFYWDITPEQLLEKFAGYAQKFWTAERKAKANALGMSPEEVETIASIVEEETNKSDERGKVARLYLNRVKTGMPLQADPTVKFAIGDFSIKRLTINMTRFQSPYNTYIAQGLPPGPIRLPEKKTIDAVLNAPAHDYLYMCAKEDFSGYHNFAADYPTHMANAQRYQAELNKRGIK